MKMSMIDKEGYKVVRRLGDRLESCFHVKLDAVVEYRVGEWTSPNAGCGPLALFDTLEHAIEFNEKRVPRRSIYKCEYVPSPQRWLSRGYQSEVWSALPKGTLLANAIKLEKKER